MAVGPCEQYCSEPHGTKISMRKLFLGAPLAEGCRDFLLLYARGRVAALTEILLLGAVTHHAGMSNPGSLLGLGFLRHAKYSVRCIRWVVETETPSGSDVNHSAASARSLNGRPSFCQTSTKASAKVSISASS